MITSLINQVSPMRQFFLVLDPCSSLMFFTCLEVLSLFCSLSLWDTHISWTDFECKHIKLLISTTCLHYHQADINCSIDLYLQESDFISPPPLQLLYCYLNMDNTSSYLILAFFVHLFFVCSCLMYVKRALQLYAFASVDCFCVQKKNKQS